MNSRGPPPVRGGGGRYPTGRGGRFYGRGRGDEFGGGRGGGPYNEGSGRGYYRGGGGRDSFGRGGRGGGGYSGRAAYEGGRGGRYEYDDVGGRGSSVPPVRMSSYSSLGRGIGTNNNNSGPGAPPSNNRYDNDLPPPSSSSGGPPPRVAMGSYSALAGPIVHPPRYGDMDDDAAIGMNSMNNNINNPPPMRGSYSALADSIIMDPPPTSSRPSYSSLSNEPPLNNSQIMPPMKRPRSDYDGPNNNTMYDHQGPPTPREYMDRPSGLPPPRDPYNNVNMDTRNDGYTTLDPRNNSLDRNDDFGPSSRPLPPGGDWGNDSNRDNPRQEYINNNNSNINNYEDRMAEDQFGRSRPPPMRGGLGRGGGFGGRSGGGSARGGGGVGGPPPHNNQRYRDRFDDDAIQSGEDQRLLTTRRDSSGRFDDTDNNNFNRKPPMMSDVDRSNSDLQKLNYQRQQQGHSADNNNNNQQQHQQEAANIIPSSPPRTPSPEPAPPSAFTMALMRMVEMNADMEFAHVKLKMLEIEHKRVMARLEALEEINKDGG